MSDDVQAALEDLLDMAATAARGVGRLIDGERMRAHVALVAQALALAQCDREGDWTTLADRLNSCLREAQLPEVMPRVERIKDGMMALLYALNRTKAELARCESDGQRMAGYLDEAETRAEVAESTLAEREALITTLRSKYEQALTNWGTQGGELMMERYARIKAEQALAAARREAK